MPIYAPNSQNIARFVNEIDESNNQIQAALIRIEKAVELIESKQRNETLTAFLQFIDSWRKSIDIHTSALKTASEQLQKSIDKVS